MIYELTEEEYNSLSLHQDQKTPLQEREYYGSAIEVVRIANIVARDDYGEYSFSKEFAIFNGNRGLKKQKKRIGQDSHDWEYWVEV